MTVTLILPVVKIVPDNPRGFLGSVVGVTKGEKVWVPSEQVSAYRRAASVYAGYCKRVPKPPDAEDQTERGSQLFHIPILHARS